MNDILTSARGDLAATAPIIEVVVGILGLILVIFLHGVGIRTINRRFSEAWVSVTPQTPRWRVNGVLALTIAALSLVHLAETLLWAAPIAYAGIIPGLRDSYYYVLESYTTLGEGAVALPPHWRLLGPIIAMSGLFTFGWTASVLVSVMTEFGKLDRLRARHHQDGDPES